MKFILLFGPQAVGKMTVGHELEEMTELKLFHNHMTIELLHPLFGFGTEMTRLSTLFRKEIFESVSKSELDGIIFTFVWAFDVKEDWDFVDEICHIFESKGADVYFVELEADVNERLARNKTEHRLTHKATKNNIVESENELKRTYQAHRLNSQKGEIKRSQYMRIDNTNLGAKEVASMIKEEFGL